MRLLGCVVFAVAVPVLAASGAASARGGLDGNRLLAQVAKVNRMPKTYAVPLHFVVRLHKPVSLRLGVKATSYFRAPDKQALVLTSVPRVIGRLFSRKYADLDTIPQSWPEHYDVRTVNRVQSNGVSAYRLDAVPKYTGDITHVTFDVAKPGLRPLGAAWYYKDGSTVRLAVVNQRVGGYVLPQREDVSVSMPRFALDATGDAGTYLLDAPIPDGVFEDR